MGNIIVIVIVLAIVAAIICYIVSQKKKGVKCIGCGHAKSCGKKCDGNDKK